MTIPAGPKIDCHIHAIDPVRFPYADDTPYRPSGQEIAPAAHLIRVLDAFDVSHALIVGTNSGYGTDSRILLDTLKLGNGRFKGVAVVENDVDIGELERLKAAGVVGVAFNVPFHSTDYYRNTAPLAGKTGRSRIVSPDPGREDQLLALLPLIEKSNVRLVIRSLRPAFGRGRIAAEGFQALLAIGRERDAWIKLSGYYKFSRQAASIRGHLAVHHGAGRRLHARSLRLGLGLSVPARARTARLRAAACGAAPAVSGSDDRHRLLWRTPARLLGFADARIDQDNKKTRGRTS